MFVTVRRRLVTYFDNNGRVGVRGRLQQNFSRDLTFSRLILTARLAQSVEHETLNLRVVGSSPTLGDDFFSLHFYKNYYLFIYLF